MATLQGWGSNAGVAGASMGATPQAAMADPLRNVVDLETMPEEVEEKPDFDVNHIQYRAPAAMKKIVAANHMMVIALGDHRIVRLNLQDTSDTYEIPCWKDVTVRVYNIFMDPTGEHCFISMTNNDVLYLNRESSNPVRLAKLKEKSKLECIAWDEMACHSQGVETNRILFAFANGALYQGSCTNALYGDGSIFVKDLVFNKVYQFPDGTLITSMKWFRLSLEHESTGYLFVACTATKMYRFVGGINWMDLFAAYNPGPDGQHRLQPIEYHNTSLKDSQFSFWKKPPANPLMPSAPGAEYFGWLTGAGFLHGPVTLKENANENIAMPTQQFTLMKFPDPMVVPVAFMITETHFVFVYGGKIQVVSRLASKEKATVVWEYPVSGYPFIGFTHDAKSKNIFVYQKTNIYTFAVKDEISYLWKQFLSWGQYDLALKFAKRPDQRELIHKTQVDVLWKAKKYDQAAIAMAHINRSFEDVMLDLIHIGSHQAMCAFLKAKLSTLEYAQATQKTMLATWLLELYLKQLDDLDYKTTPEANAEKQQVTQDIKSLFQTHVKDLNSITTFSLLSSYGRTLLVSQYALLIQDYDRLLSFFLEQRRWEQALALLPKLEPELLVKYASILMYNEPEGTINMLMTIHSSSRVNPRDLIPALMRCDDSKIKGAVHPVMRYLEFVIAKGSTDPEIHNFLIGYYARLPDEKKLTTFILQHERKKIYFEPDFALQLCTKYNKRVSEVFIFGLMGLWEEAVTLALKLNLALAKEVANKPSSEETRKALWMMIVRNLVEVKADIKAAMLALQQCNLLTIEDIIRFLPDASAIEDFSEEIQTCLEESNQRVDDLKWEMQQTTEAQDRILKDIEALEKKRVEIPEAKICDLSKLPVLGKQFCLFPDGSCYLVSNLLDELEPLLPAKLYDRCIDLYNEIEDLGSSPFNKDEVAELRKELYGIIAAEHPKYSKLFIESVTEPFPEDDDEELWQL